MGCRALKTSEYSYPNSPDCVYTRQIEAEKQFLRRGLAGPVYLNRVLDENGVKHLLWVCELPDKQEAFLPVFIDDFAQELPERVAREDVTDQTFVYRLGRSYKVFRQKNGRVNVRLITVFWHQALVEAMCRAQGFEPQEVYLMRLVDLNSREEYGIGWQIVYQDGEKTDQGQVLAVDLREAPRLGALDSDKLDYLPIDECEKITIRDICYEVFKNEHGLYFLGRDLLQVSKCKHK